MAEQENPNIKWRKITALLQRIVECPICLDTIKVPFKTCGTGHGVCTTCCENLQKCPICEDIFLKENPICLKNLLEALPRFCQYSEDGCEEILEQGNNHELFCACRPMVCPEPMCDVTVPLQTLMNHYENDHPNVDIWKTPTKNYSMPSEDIAQQIAPSVSIPVLLFDNLFWLVTQKDVKEQCYKYFLIATPMKKVKNDYYVDFKFEVGQFRYRNIIKANILSSCKIEGFIEELGNCSMSDNTSSDSEEVDFMKFPLRATEELLKGGIVKFTLSFFEKVK